MALSKCARCEKLFDKISSAVCGACIDDEDKDYEVIRDALRETPNSSAEQVAELTGVDMACVLRMLDSGLISTLSLGDKIKCGRCGEPAISTTKRLCQGCLDKLNQQVAKATGEIRLSSKKRVEVDEYSNVRSMLHDKRK